MSKPLQPFGDPEIEARSLLEHYSPGAIVEWIGRYEFLIEQLEDAKRGGLTNLDALLTHARRVHELLRLNCRAGDRIE